MAVAYLINTASLFFWIQCCCRNAWHHIDFLSFVSDLVFVPRGTGDFFFFFLEPNVTEIFLKLSWSIFSSVRYNLSICKFSYSGKNKFYILGVILLIFSLFTSFLLLYFGFTFSTLQFGLLHLLWSPTLLWLIIFYILQFYSFTFSDYLYISSLLFIYNFINI